MPLDPSMQGAPMGGMSSVAPAGGAMMQPQQAQLNAPGMSGPGGAGGAATAQGVAQAMPPEAQQPMPGDPAAGGQPQQPQAPGPAGMGAPPPAWSPGVDGQMLYSDGNGPVTGQVPKLAADGLSPRTSAQRKWAGVVARAQHPDAPGGLLGIKGAFDAFSSYALQNVADRSRKTRQTDEGEEGAESVVDDAPQLPPKIAATTHLTRPLGSRKTAFDWPGGPDEQGFPDPLQGPSGLYGQGGQDDPMAMMRGIEQIGADEGNALQAPNIGQQDIPEGGASEGNDGITNPFMGTGLMSGAPQGGYEGPVPGPGSMLERYMNSPGKPMDDPNSMPSPPPMPRPQSPPGLLGYGLGESPARPPMPNTEGMAAGMDPGIQSDFNDMMNLPQTMAQAEQGAAPSGPPEPDAAGMAAGMDPGIQSDFAAMMKSTAPPEFQPGGPQRREAPQGMSDQVAQGGDAYRALAKSPLSGPSMPPTGAQPPPQQPSQQPAGRPQSALGTYNVSAGPAGPPSYQPPQAPPPPPRPRLIPGAQRPPADIQRPTNRYQEMRYEDLPASNYSSSGDMQRQMGRSARENYAERIANTNRADAMGRYNPELGYAPDRGVPAGPGFHSGQFGNIRDWEGPAGQAPMPNMAQRWGATPPPTGQPQPGGQPPPQGASPVYARLQRARAAREANAARRAPPPQQAQQQQQQQQQPPPPQQVQQQPYQPQPGQGMSREQYGSFMNGTPAPQQGQAPPSYPPAPAEPQPRAPQQQPQAPPPRQGGYFSRMGESIQPEVSTQQMPGGGTQTTRSFSGHLAPGSQALQRNQSYMGDIRAQGLQAQQRLRKPQAPAMPKPQAPMGGAPGAGVNFNNPTAMPAPMGKSSFDLGKAAMVHIIGNV